MKLITTKSKYAFPQTLDMIRQLLQQHDVRLFTSIDHKAAAEEAGLKLQPTTLLIFGKPDSGTLLMHALDNFSNAA
jgi:uncharacterized protein (DUF302 family)